MSKKFFSSIAGASILITAVGILSRALGFLREVIFAASFGLSHNFEIYLVAAILPLTINTIILYLGQNYFMPIYSSFPPQEEESREKFFYSAFTTFMVGGIVLAILLWLLSSKLLNFYLNYPDINTFNTAYFVFIIFLITIPLSAVISILSVFFQAHKNFLPPAASQLFLNVTFIILVPVFAKGMTIFIIPIAYLIGSVLQLSYLIWCLKKFNILRIINLKQINFHRFGFLFVVILIEIIGQFYILADRYFLDQVNQGGIAALNYSLTIYYLPIAIFSLSVSTAIFPVFSQIVANRTELKRVIGNTLVINCYFFIPIALLFFLKGDLLIRLLLQRGNFTSGDTLLTFNLLKIYSFSLIFYSAYSIINKLYFSLKKASTLLIISLVVGLLKLLLNFYLVKDYKQDGLAMSSSICYSVIFLLSLINLTKYIRHNFFVDIYKDIIFYLLTGIITFYIVKLISSLFTSSSTLLSEIISIFCFIILYNFSLYLVKDRSVKILTNIFVNYAPFRR